MAKPVTRAEFREYCLRKLGKPVIEINVDEDQVEDRIDEGIAYWNDYHFDGVEKIFLKHVITANTVANEYITISDNIIGIVDIFAINGTINSSNMFDVRYQFALSNAHDISNYSMQEYFMTMQHIALIQEMMIGQKPLRYNRHVNKLRIDMDWDRVEIGNYIIAECYQVIDPDVYTDMWSDRWLQNYVTAKIKYQWGSNLTKFVGMQLPGGLQFNGEQILNDASSELQKLEDEMLSSYSLPVHDLMG